MMSTTEDPNEHYKQLKFEPSKSIDPNGKKKYFAVCKICGTHLKNTSLDRLTTHRKSCNGIKRVKGKRSYDIIPNIGKVAIGRHLSKYYAKLGYKSAKLKKQNGQVTNVAICLVCNADLRNTGWKRLQAHRNICFSDKYGPLNADESVDENIPDEAGAIPDEAGTVSNVTVNKTKLGRKEGKYYKLLGYVPTAVANKYGKVRTMATCLVCHKNVANTSSRRLYVHRKACKSEKYNVELVAENLVDAVGADNLETSVKIETCDEENSFDDQLQTYNPQNTLIIEVKPEDNVSDASAISDISNVKKAIANFVFGCSLPLNITESSQFQHLIKILNPSQEMEIPDRDELLNSLLPNNYEKYLEEAIQLWNLEESSMIVGTLKCKNGQKFLVSMLQDAVRGIVAYVHCIELKNCSDEATVFKQMVKDSIALAKSLYNTHVYAIVSDQLISDGNEVWYVNCQKDLAESLLKEFLDTMKYKTCLFKVKCIMEALRDHKFKEELPLRESHLGSDVDNLYFLTDNWDDLHKSLNADVVLKQKRDIILAFLDLKFKCTCYSCAEQITLLNQFIKKLSLPNCSLADSVILWQNFLKNPIVRSSNTLLVLVEEKHLQIKNQYCLVAHYFGEGRASDFSGTERDAIKRFLAQVLSEQGHEEYNIFENGDSSALAGRDDLYKSSDFWEMMEKEMPNLSEVALKMLRIPASSGVITEIFSEFSLNDPVSREECSKLMAVYFHSKLDGKS